MARRMNYVKHLCPGACHAEGCEASLSWGMSCHEKVTGTCHSERSEESEVGHAARLVRPDASLPLSMTREGAFFTACYDKRPLTCHAERQRSIWFHQPG